MSKKNIKDLVLLHSNDMHGDFLAEEEGGLRIVCSREKHDFDSFTYQGQPVQDDDMLTVSLQNFHLNNCDTSLGITLEELQSNGKPVVLTTSEHDVLIEYFLNNPYPEVPVLDRLIVY